MFLFNVSISQMMRMYIKRQKHQILIEVRIHLNTLTMKFKNLIITCQLPKQELSQIFQEKLFLLFIGLQNKRVKGAQRKTLTVSINNKQTLKNNKLRIFRTLRQSKKADLLRHQLLNLILLGIYKALECCKFSQILNKNKMYHLILCSHLSKQLHRQTLESLGNINTVSMKSIKLLKPVQHFIKHHYIRICERNIITTLMWIFIFLIVIAHFKIQFVNCLNHLITLHHYIKKDK